MAQELWGYLVANHGLVEDVYKCEGYEDLSPCKGVYGSREAVIEAVVNDMNEEIAEILEDRGSDEVISENLKWHDAHAYDNRKRWRTYSELTDCHYVIFEMELIK